MRAKHYLLAGLVILAAIFFRLHRTADFLGFWFDQGRDALVIWDLIHSHKFFLIGPTTGIEGIFRGPWYYWLITPAYFLGKGDPVWPAVFLATTTILAVILCAKIANRLAGPTAGLLALLICGLSFEFVQSARWLSNPTPMFLISMIIVYLGLKIIDGQKNYWIPLTFVLGMAMQFGSATEVFFYPAFGLLALLYKKSRPSLAVFFLMCISGIVPFLPIIVFDFRHDHIQTKNIIKFLVTDKSFQLSFLDNLKVRLPFYLRLVGSKLSPSYDLVTKMFIFLSIFSAIKNFKKLSPHIKFLLLLCFLPLVGMIFFQGNNGNVYDYYFTGYHFIFILAFSILLPKALSARAGTVLAVCFACLFLKNNLPKQLNFIFAQKGPFVTLTPETQAVDWIYQDSRGEEFNVDFYVPPMIPYSYQYLFSWRGSQIHHRLPKENTIKLLYTIQEPDPGHQTLLDTWRTRQAGFSSVEYSHTIDSLLIERRHRHD